MVTVGLGAAVVVAGDGGLAARLLRTILVAALAIAVVAAVDRGRGRAAALGLGAAAATTGSALAVQHLAGAGLDVVATGGVLLGIGGVVLLGSALRAGVARAAGWRKALVPLVAIVLLGVSAELVTIPVLVTNLPASSDPRRPADVGLDARDVRIPARGGVSLAAWYVPPRNGTLVILLHGAGSTRAAALPHAEVLVGRGFGALLLDATGHGDSGGRAMDLGWQGDGEVAAALDWVDEVAGDDVSSVALLGLSMGAEVAIGAAAADDRVVAVVAEGATGRVAADNAWLSDEHGARGWFQEQLDRAQEAVVDLLTDARPPAPLRSSAAEAGIPMLLIAAGEVPDEPLAAAFIEAGAEGDVDVWVVEGSGHTEALRTDPTGWEQRVVSFLEAAAAAPT